MIDVVEKCKLVVRRFSSGLDFMGDCVNSYPIDFYLGELVEPQGGAFVIIEVVNASPKHPVILALIENELEPITANKKQFLQPVLSGDEFFYELLTVGRITVTLAKLQEYIRAH